MGERFRPRIAQREYHAFAVDFLESGPVELVSELTICQMVVAGDFVEPRRRELNLFGGLRRMGVAERARGEFLGDQSAIGL